MNTVRYAVVGAGGISQAAFMPAVAQTGNSELTAIVTGNADNAARLAEFYGIRHVFPYGRYDDALSSGLFDAVYIGLPNSLHAEYAIRAAEKGIHALVEKPLAVSVAECESMIAAAERHGVKLMTAYRLHCEPGTVEVLNRIADGEIGAPRLFESMFSFQAPASDHRLKREHWGGPLQDIGVYCLNAARHVFRSEPIEAVAMKTGGSDSRFAEVEESISATLRFPGGAIAAFTVSFNAPDTDMCRILGTNGEIIMDPAFRHETATRMVLRRRGRITRKTFPDIDHFGAETAYFSDCILTGQEPEADGGEGLADVRALRAIEAAADTGRSQPIDSPPRPRHPSHETVRMIERPRRRLIL